MKKYLCSLFVNDAMRSDNDKLKLITIDAGYFRFASNANSMFRKEYSSITMNCLGSGLVGMCCKCVTFACATK